MDMRRRWQEAWAGRDFCGCFWPCPAACLHSSAYIETAPPRSVRDAVPGRRRCALAACYGRSGLRPSLMREETAGNVLLQKTPTEFCAFIAACRLPTTAAANQMLNGIA